MLALMLVGQVADLATTLVAFHLGLAEGNPLMSRLGAPSIITAKVAGCAAMTAAYLVLLRVNRPAAQWVAGPLVVAIGSEAAGHNLGLILN